MPDIGFGLGKMAEGITGGMLKGTMANMQKDERDRQFDQNKLYQDTMLSQGQQRIDNEQDRYKIQRSATALSTALSIAEKAKNPEMRKAAFESAYRAVYPDAEEIPDIIFPTSDSDPVSINFKGLQMTVDREYVQDAMDLISKNPDRTPEILGKLAELGVADITVPKKEGSFAAMTPGQGIFDKDTGKIIQSPDIDAYTKAKGKKTGGLKVSDINTALTAIFKKYKIDQGLGFTVREDDTPKVDMAQFLAGKETAYNIIRQSAAGGDPDAAADLKKVTDYYDLMDVLIRGLQPGAQSGAFFENMNNAGTTTAQTPEKERRIFSPITGRITLK